MGYLHIENLYKNKTVLLFRECYALEKVHGTSAHVGIAKDRQFHVFSGGAKHEEFAALFPAEFGAKLAERYPTGSITLYGEAYGGKVQKMTHAYGKDLRFVVFDVRLGERWMCVPEAAAITESLGLEFVPWLKIPTDRDAIDRERDAESDIGVRRGIMGAIREGVVLRPLMELDDYRGNRIIAKHKRAEFSERAHQPKVDDPNQAAILIAADSIANEWVTEMRLEHILGRGTIQCDTEAIPDLIAAMVEDVEREAAGEIMVSKEARKAIGKRTAFLVKQRLANSIGQP